jgi:hypothetical protein
LALIALALILQHHSADVKIVASELNLALKDSWLMQNISQPIIRTDLIRQNL